MPTMAIKIKIMQDGAQQEIEMGRFVIYTHQKTATMSLGCIVGGSETRVKIEETYSYNGQPTNKTPERVIMVSDDVAKSKNLSFYNKMIKTR